MGVATAVAVAVGGAGVLGGSVSAAALGGGWGSGAMEGTEEEVVEGEEVAVTAMAMQEEAMEAMEAMPVAVGAMVATMA